MKKFFEKHDLVKISGIMILITVLLTWVIPQGYFSGTEFAINDITRIGIFDFFTYGLLGMYYFTVLVTFVFVLGGFYQVLSRISGYQKLTENIAKTFKGKEILFVLLTSFIIAALTAISNEYFVIMAGLPFVISIMSKMQFDKLTAFVTTFGSILIGTLGSIYSTKIVGQNVSTLAIDYNTYLWVKLVIFFVAFILFSLFTILHLRKNKSNKNKKQIEEVFTSDKLTKKGKVWPIATILTILGLTTLLAYLPWEEVFKVTIFTDAHKAVMEAQVFDSTIFAYILGTLNEFGSWDIFGIQVLMLITIVIIKFGYKININDILTDFGEGFKKVSKLVVLLLLTYVILEFTVMFPVIPTIVDWFMHLTTKFNVIMASIAGLFTSLFTVEYQYTVSLIGSYLTSTYAEFTKQIAILLQSTYGLSNMITPASAILLMGLSYCGITYKDWFKYIWKFLLIMLILIITLMLIIF